MKNYTPHHLLLFTGINVQCEGASTWLFHDKKQELTPSFLITLIDDNAIDWVKPILFPLSAMTDEQAIHITKLALNIQDGHITDNTTFAVKIDDEEIKIKAHYYNTALESYDDDIVIINDSFDISYSKYSLSAFNQPQIFQYLIQCQFDVFGWIKEKIALDKTKL